MCFQPGSVLEANRLDNVPVKMKSLHSMNLIPELGAPRAPPCRQPGANAAVWGRPTAEMPLQPAALLPLQEPTPQRKGAGWGRREVLVGASEETMEVAISGAQPGADFVL